MRLVPVEVPKWPKLAWVAQIAKGSDEVRTYHGPMVETSDDWIVEAVWAGDFAAGDFDRTDLVFGSGVRLRGSRVFFVSSGTTFDSLWRVELGETTTVSNSLPSILAVGGLSLSEAFSRYSERIYSITRGLNEPKSSLPTETKPVRRTCFQNLVFGKGLFREVDKPYTTPPFTSFSQYYRYLIRSAERLGRNSQSTARKHRVELLSTVSSGYDSSAAAAISRFAGCRDAATIKQSTSLWRGSDSGRIVADHLGLTCRSYERAARSYPFEEAVWAATGRPGDLNLTLFDYPEPLSVLFVGNHGDLIWSTKARDLSDPFVHGGFSGRGFCEFRLLQGVFQCVVPFWGFRHAQEIQQITHSEQMAPWTLNNAYDRPIPRRILEESGVPRNAFGMRKKNTSLETPFLWPYSPEAQESFCRYLQQRGIEPPSNAWIGLARRLSHWDNLLYMNLTKRLGIDLRLRHRLKHPGAALIFQWANHELKKRYEEGLRALEGDYTKDGTAASAEARP